MDWILDLLTPLGTTSTCNAIADLHTFTARSVNSRFLVTDVNSGNSTHHHAQLLLSRFQYRTACQISTDSGVTTPELDCRFSTELHAPINFFIFTFHGPIRKHSFQQQLYYRRGPFTDSILRNRLHNTVFLLLRACILRAIPSNGRCLQSQRPATGLYATIF
jgi:hypothetical protein